MTASSRTGKLFSALTARERARAVLRAWKEAVRRCHFGLENVVGARR